MLLKDPFWYSLIISLKTKKVITNGLTLPYIIGADKVINKKPFDDNSIPSLLKNIVNSQTEQIAVFQNCTDINQYVVGVENLDFCNLYFKNYLSFNNQENSKSLYITPNALSFGTTIAEIEKNLIDKFQGFIQDEKFSWNRSTSSWEKFTPKEIEILNSV